jgi:plasmid stabilization system protein ParE
VKLKILEEARAQYREQSAWWREHRDAKALFAQEFLAAIRHLRTAPETGTLYAKRRGRAIRRWLMPKTGYHVYYRLDRENDLLVIYSVWGARRGRDPTL